MAIYIAIPYGNIFLSNKVNLLSSTEGSASKFNAYNLAEGPILFLRLRSEKWNWNEKQQKMQPRTKKKTKMKTRRRNKTRKITTRTNRLLIEVSIVNSSSNSHFN